MGKPNLQAEFDALPDLHKEFEALPDHVGAPPPETSEPDALDPKSVAGTAVRQFANGGSLSMGDEIGGAMGAVDEIGRRGRTALGFKSEDDVPVEQENLPLWAATLARYRRERDAGRQELAEGAKANPNTAALSDIAGSLALPLPGPGKAKGVANLVKYGTKVGLASGLGASDADLTRGDFGGALRDTLAGGAGGAATTLVTAPIQAGASKLSGLLRRESAGVRADKYGKLADAADKEIASLKGSADQATQAGSRANENLVRATQGVPGAIGSASVDPATQLRALQTLDRPDFKALADKVANNTVDSVPDRLARIRSTEAAHSAAVAGRDSKINNQFRDYFGRSTIKEDVLPRVGRSLVNAGIGAAGGAALGVPAALGASALGYDPKAAFAGSVGLGMSMAAAPGSGLKTMVRNLKANPRFQNATLNTLSGGVQSLANKGMSFAGAQAGEETSKKLDRDQRDEEAVQALIDGF